MKKVVISIDFELRWGVADVFGHDINGYRKNLEGVREVVPRLLELFARLNVSATWATVAAVALSSWDEYFALAPAPPEYLNRALLPPKSMSNLDKAGRLHFAPELVEQIARSPHQELASHSFSHFFFGEAGFVRRDAIADAAAVARLFMERFGAAPTSFVFPRNQVGFIDVLSDHGIRTVRTNPSGAIWQTPIELREWAPMRAARFAASFAGIAPARRDGPQLPASSFVRLNLPESLFRVHRAALARAASRLAEPDCLHLWFHPHNLGDAPTARVARLESVLLALMETAPDIRFVSMTEC